MSKLGNDFFGRYLHSYLEEQGVTTRFLAHDPQALSTLVFVTMEQGEPAYTFYGEGAADTRLLPEEIPDSFFDETRILHFSSINRLTGTMPMTVVSTAKRLQGQVLLSFDPNVRPAVIHDAAAYRDLIRVLVGYADLVKISAVDLEWLAAGQSIETAAAHLLAQGPALVVVTRGNAGVLALRAGEQPDDPPQHWELPAFQVDVVDTVGAGDAFSSGLLTALAEHGTDTRQTLLRLDGAVLAEALRFAAAVAALTCTRASADPPTRDGVNQFLSAS